MPTTLDSLLGRLAVERGVLTASQLDAALRRQAAERPAPPLGVVLVEHAGLTHAQVDTLLASQAEALAATDPRAASDLRAWRFGTQAIAAGRATAEQVHRAFREQARREEAHEPWAWLGEILVAQGALRPEHLATLLRIHDPAETRADAPTLPAQLARPRRDDETLSASAPVAAAAAAPAGSKSDADVTPLVPRSPSPTGAPPAPPSLGRSLGKYELLDVLGRGGMGIVYRALDTELRRVVALKTLLLDDDAGGQGVERLLREARTAAALDHPGIIPIYDVGSVGTVPYFAMAYVRGRTFRDVLAAQPPPSLRERVAVIQTAAEAVAHAHARGVIHRDLKPGNLLIDEAGGVHVMDFGLAKRLDERSRLTASGQILGTPHYMPPEQVNAEADRIGPRTDVYALGAVLYEVLTGEPPHTGTTMGEILRKVIMSEPELPRRRDPRIPQDLETVCVKALAKEPERRYATAQELADELGRWLRGEAIRARPESWAEGWVRWTRRRKALAGLAAALFLVASGAGVLGWRARAAERAQAQLTADVLSGLRDLATSNLLATLMVRRSGAKMSEAQTGFLGPLEAAARRAVAAAPKLAEPHFVLGRMYRALLRFPDAAREQDRALVKEPGYPPSLYERAVLGAREYQERLAAARTAAWSRAGAALAAAGGLAPGGGGGLKEATVDELEAADADLRAAKERTVALLERLRAELERDPAWQRRDPALLRVGPEKVACVRGLLAAYGGGGDWSAARTALASALAGDAQLEEAYEALYHAATRSGRWDDAIEAAGMGLAVDRGYVPHWISRGKARMTAGIVRMVRGADPGELFAGAIADHGQALELAPAWVEAWTERGHARANWGVFKMGRGEDPAELFGAAIADFDRALGLEAKSPATLIGRGNVRVNWGQARQRRGADPAELYAAAIVDYGQAIEVAPTAAEAWVRRGDARTGWAIHRSARGADPSDLYTKAMADYDRALALAPAAPEGWAHRASARLNWGVDRHKRGADPSELFDAAIADYGQALRLGVDASSAESWWQRGAAERFWGDCRADSGADPSELYRAAIADCGKALGLNAASTDAWCGRADARLSWGEYKLGRGEDAAGLFAGAVEDYGKALELNRTLAPAWLGRGSARATLGQIKRARGEDAKADFAAAVGDLETSLKLDANQPDARQVLEQLRAALGGEGEGQKK